MSIEQELEAFMERELNDFMGTMKAEHDLILIVLRFHLLIENCMERLILAKLPRGDRLLEKAGLSFSQKLAFIEAFEAIEDRYIQSIRHLNTIRNECAHQKGRQISTNDIERIGRTLGKVFTQIRRKNQGDLYQYILLTFIEVFKRIMRALACEEMKDVLKIPQDGLMANPACTGGT